MKKTVLVTGGSRGIGRAICRTFAHKGYNVVVNYNRSEEEALALVRELTDAGCEAYALQADVSDPHQVRRMVSLTVAKYGRVDVLINNAGIALQKLFTETSCEDFDRIMDVNLKSVFHCTKSVIPYMLEQMQGKIINISSIWGLVGASCEVAYSTAKAGVIGMTKALAKELGLSNIQVNCIAPGIIDTEMNAFLSAEDAMDLKEQTPLNRFGTPEEIASLALYLASEEANFITGQVISPNGGFVI